MPNDQERANKVAEELRQVSEAFMAKAPVYVMHDGETGGPCRWCGEYVTSGQRYVLAASGFEDHADCAGVD